MSNAAIPTSRGSGEPEFSLTVSRALQVLAAFDVNRTELGVSEIARMLSLSRTAIQRLVQTLEIHHFLEQNPETRKYRIGVQAFRIGNLFALGRQLETLARPDMEALAARATFTVYLSVLRHDAMVMTAAIEGSGPLRYNAQVGQRLPLHSTAAGKVALASLSPAEADAILARTGQRAITPNTITDRAALHEQLAEIRDRGFSVNRGENTPGVGSIAAPIFDANGRLLAVLSNTFATSQVAPQDIDALGRDIAQTARGIAEKARSSPATAAA